MAGTDRRFVTRRDVDDAKAAGQPIRLGTRDVLTDEAATRARDLRVQVQRAAAGGRPPAGPGAGRAVGGGPELRAVVRRAVIAELGGEPPGLDAVLDRVLASRGSSAPD